MSKKEENKNLIELNDADEIQANPWDLEEQGLFEFIKNKLAENLEVNINIKKNKDNGKISLSFSANYDDEINDLKRR